MAESQETISKDAQRESEEAILSGGVAKLRPMAESQEKISKGVKRELEEAISSGGVAKLKDLILKKNNEWRNIPLNIAIIGSTGVGKSSFINAIRGITADDEGGAQVGVVETTIDIHPYPHPKNSSMVFWDLPGVGTQTFPRETYLQKVDLKNYDFFLILFADRCTENDLWLAKEIRSHKKHFFFVRTKMKNVVNDDKSSHPKTHSKDKVIELARKDGLQNLEDCQKKLEDCQKKIEEDCQTNLKDYDLTRAPVFLIDNHSPRDFDFDSLTRTLIDEAPGHKREAMVLSMSVLTDGVIERKVEALQGRIYKVSLLSAVAGAIPIPGIGGVIDCVLVLEKVKFYKSQLGLDAETINEHARCLNTEASQLEQKLGLQSVRLATTAKGVAQIASNIASSEVFESVLPIAIPILGSLISAGISYGVTVKSLQYLLGIFSKDARKINEEILKNSLH